MACSNVDSKLRSSALKSLTPTRLLGVLLLGALPLQVFGAGVGPIRIAGAKGATFVRPVIRAATEKGDRLSLSKDQVLQEGDILETGEDGELQVLVGPEKGIGLYLKKNSKAYLSKTEFGTWQLNLDRGIVISRVNPEIAAPSGKSKFQVKIKGAVMGVRGTVFFVKTEPKKSPLLCVCSGVVTVDEKAIIVGKNHDSPKGPVGNMQPATVGEDHTDAEGDLLGQLMK